MGKIVNYKYIITYKVNGKKETLGRKTEAEKEKAIQMMKHANKPKSRCKNKYKNIIVKEI